MKGVKGGKKKNILLIKPINDIYYIISPNLGLGYLATTLIKNGHHVDIINSGKEKLTYEQFKNIILENNYDIIGFQVFTYEMVSVKKHSDIIKKISPDTVVIVGGPQPSGDPQGTMEYLKNVDFGFVGECEIALPEFAKLSKEDLHLKEKLRKIPNLIWRSKGSININDLKSFDDLDTLDFPAWEFINPNSYPAAPHGTFTKNFPVAPIIVTRGCPYQCTFCAGFKITGRKLRSRSVGNVIKEMELLYYKYSVREFHIEDDNFTLKKDLVIGICGEIIKRKLKISWSCPNGIRLDTLDEELVKLMEKSGCYSIAVGIESGSDKILKSMKKLLNKAKIKEKINMIKKNTKIKITGFFMIGYPRETEEDVLETIRFAKELKIDKADFAFMMPLPGTEVWYNWKNSQKSKNCNYENFFFYKIVPLSNIHPKRLRRLHKKAMWGFYARPKIILGLLSEIKTWNQIKLFLKRFKEIYI